MMMKRIMLVVAWVVCLSPAVARAQAAKKEATTHRVAVVALDDGARSGSLMQTVSGLLDRAQFDVVMGERLRRVLAQRQVAKPRAAVAAKFAGMANVIADGVEQFFYKGNQAAIDKLSPVFDMGMADLEVLARRPDFAAQIYQAGLVMIRAYKNLHQEENAEAVAQLLVKSLPGLEPSPATAPPKIIRFIKSERDKLAQQKTTLAVEMVDDHDCTAYINGSPVEAKKPYPVAGATKYMVTMDCGGAAAPVWQLTVDKGAAVVAPVAPSDPLEVVMKSGDFRERRRAEAYLRLVAFWGDAPRVLGVTRAAAAHADETLLFVRVDHDGNAQWSDSTDERAISRGLARVLPSFHQTGAGVQPQPADAKVDWVGWSLVGGGVALMGVGTWVAVAAEGRATQVECSPDTDYGTSASDCKGVDIVRFADQSELDKAESQVTWARVAGYGSLAVGVGLSAWGVWRLVSPEAPAAGGAAVSVSAYPTARGAQASVRWRF